MLLNKEAGAKYYLIHFHAAQAGRECPGAHFQKGKIETRE